MKKLHLIRHAKSSWRDGSLADIERPLNRRGWESCALMAEPIRKAGCPFEHVFCSSAVRAQQTIENIAWALSPEISKGAEADEEAECPIQWQCDPDLYTFVMEGLVSWCKKLDDTLTEVVIVGHNAAMTEFVNAVGNQRIDNLPTCGYVQLALSIDRWAAIAPNTGKLLSLLTPKMLRS